MQAKQREREKRALLKPRRVLLAYSIEREAGETCLFLFRRGAPVNKEEGGTTWCFNPYLHSLLCGKEGEGGGIAGIVDC